MHDWYTKKKQEYADFCNQLNNLDYKIKVIGYVDDKKAQAVAQATTPAEALEHRFLCLERVYKALVDTLANKPVERQAM